jgi:hypothetical protein
MVRILEGGSEEHELAKRSAYKLKTTTWIRHNSTYRGVFEIDSALQMETTVDFLGTVKLLEVAARVDKSAVSRWLPRPSKPSSDSVKELVVLSESETPLLFSVASLVVSCTTRSLDRTSASARGKGWSLLLS